MNDYFKTFLLFIFATGPAFYEYKTGDVNFILFFCSSSALFTLFFFEYFRHLKKNSDKKEVYREILKDLKEDEKKLLLIIPLLKIGNSSIPTKHKINTNSTYTKHLFTLRDEKNPHIEIKNKNEINLIIDWINWAEQIHRHFNKTNSPDFIKDNEDKILISLKNIKEFYTAKI